MLITNAAIPPSIKINKIIKSQFGRGWEPLSGKAEVLGGGAEGAGGLGIWDGAIAGTGMAVGATSRTVMGGAATTNWPVLLLIATEYVPGSLRWT